MPDYLGALVVPAVLVVSGLFAVCDSWRRRCKRARKARSARRASEERERGFCVRRRASCTRRMPVWPGCTWSPMTGPRRTFCTGPKRGG
jgi:hypothetical protein